MSASKDGLIPPENIIGGTPHQWGSDGLREALEDGALDAISEIEGMVGSSEIGLPRAYIEETVGDRQFRDVYTTYPYVILGISNSQWVTEAFRRLIADARAAVDHMISLGFARENLIISWRLNEKIVAKAEWCKKCGGSTSIRTRFLVKPDRHFYFGPALDRDPALIGRTTSET